MIQFVSGGGVGSQRLAYNTLIPTLSTGDHISKASSWMSRSQHMKPNRPWTTVGASRANFDQGFGRGVIFVVRGSSL